jgi:hypothetical protein
MRQCALTLSFCQKPPRTQDALESFAEAAEPARQNRAEKAKCTQKSNVSQQKLATMEERLTTVPATLKMPAGQSERSVAPGLISVPLSCINWFSIINCQKVESDDSWSV